MVFRLVFCRHGVSVLNADKSDLINLLHEIFNNIISRIIIYYWKRQVLEVHDHILLGD
jgi:hypothetical protein